MAGLKPCFQGPPCGWQGQLSEARLEPITPQMESSNSLIQLRAHHNVTTLLSWLASSLRTLRRSLQTSSRDIPQVVNRARNKKRWCFYDLICWDKRNVKLKHFCRISQSFYYTNIYCNSSGQGMIKYFPHFFGHRTCFCEEHFMGQLL